MKGQDYKASLTVGASPHEVYKGINNVAAWWNEFEGSTEKVDDAFTVQFGDVHVSTQKLVELIPDKKIVWLVTDSSINFVEKKQEWTGTRICFEIAEKNGQTEIQFTHFGLVPSIQCYEGCSKGWDYYFKSSLYKWLMEGKGTPGL